MKLYRSPMFVIQIGYLDFIKLVVRFAIKPDLAIERGLCKWKQKWCIYWIDNDDLEASCRGIPKRHFLPKSRRSMPVKIFQN